MQADTYTTPIEFVIQILQALVIMGGAIGVVVSIRIGLKNLNARVQDLANTVTKLTEQVTTLTTKLAVIEALQKAPREHRG